MVYRGCVLSLEKDYAVVMTEEAEYIKVNMKNGLIVGKQILFMEDDIYREKRSTPLYMLKYAAVFAIVLLAAVFQIYINGVYKSDKIVAAIVTLDINPSIEIEINNEGRAISLIPLNEDGAVISDKSMTGKPIYNVISELLKNAEAKEYFKSGDNFVLISMAPLTDGLNINLSDLEVNIRNMISGSDELKTINIVYASSDRAGLEEARLNKISIGRYYFYKKLKRVEPEITIEAVRNMKLEDMFYRHRFGSQSEASDEATIEKVLSEDAYEHILLRERRRVQGESDSPDIGTEIENESRNGKGSGQQYENRSMNMEKTQSGVENNEAEDTQSGGNNDVPQQNAAPAGEQQNQLQSQSGVSEESEEITGGEAIMPGYEEPVENKGSEKGKESDNRQQENKPSKEGNRK